MRTDHVTAWLIKEWLQDHAPDLASAWGLQPDAQVIGFAKKLETIIPQVRLIFVCQNILARTAIEMWDLKDVALLAGGAPTPLTPRPYQLRYYTDANPEAVEEARTAGYNARHVNVLDNSIEQLVGVKSAVATGLFHFLPDEATSNVFYALDQRGIETIAFSHATPEATPEAVRQYENLGIRMFMRDSQQLQALLPSGWQIDYCEPSGDYMRHAGELGAKLTETPRMVDFLKASKTL